MRYQFLVLAVLILGGNIELVAQQGKQQGKQNGSTDEDDSKQAGKGARGKNQPAPNNKDRGVNTQGEQQSLPGFDSKAWSEAMLQQFDGDGDMKLNRKELASCLEALAKQVIAEREQAISGNSDSRSRSGAPTEPSTGGGVTSGFSGGGFAFGSSFGSSAGGFSAAGGQATVFGGQGGPIFPPPGLPMFGGQNVTGPGLRGFRGGGGASAGGGAAVGGGASAGGGFSSGGGKR